MFPGTPRKTGARAKIRAALSTLAGSCGPAANSGARRAGGNSAASKASLAFASFFFLPTRSLEGQRSRRTAANPAMTPDAIVFIIHTAAQHRRRKIVGRGGRTCRREPGQGW